MTKEKDEKIVDVTPIRLYTGEKLHIVKCGDRFILKNLNQTKSYEKRNLEL